jgi:hypothetical protein
MVPHLRPEVIAAIEIAVELNEGTLESTRARENIQNQSPGRGVQYEEI